MIKAIFMVLICVIYSTVVLSIHISGAIKRSPHSLLIIFLLSFVFALLTNYAWMALKVAWKDRDKLKEVRNAVSRSSSTWKDRGAKFLVKAKEYGGEFRTWATPHAKAGGDAALTWSKGNPFLLMGLIAGFVTVFLMYQGKALWMLAFGAVAIFLFAKHAGKEGELKTITKKAFSKELGWWLAVLVLAGAAAFEGSTLGLTILSVTIGAGVIRLARHFKIERGGEIFLITVTLFVAGVCLIKIDYWGGLGFIIGMAGMSFGASAAFWYKTQKPLSAEEKIAKAKKEADDLAYKHKQEEIKHQLVLLEKNEEVAAARRKFELDLLQAKSKVEAEEINKKIDHLKAQSLFLSNTAEVIENLKNLGLTTKEIQEHLKKMKG